MNQHEPTNGASGARVEPPVERLTPVAPLRLPGEPDVVHLGVRSRLPRRGWFTGATTPCGRSHEEDLPPDTEVTCPECLAKRPMYERMLGTTPPAAGTPAPAGLREAIANALNNLLRAKGYDPNDPDVDHDQYDRETAEVVDALLPAVLAVRDTELEQARADVNRLAGLLANKVNELVDEQRHHEIAAKEVARLRGEPEQQRAEVELTEAEADLKRANAELSRLTGLVGQYADWGIANGQRAEQAEAALERVRNLHRPAECANARCKLGQWCIGCDPDGLDDCGEHPWPCPTIHALDGATTLAAREAPANETGPSVGTDTTTNQTTED